MRGIDKFVLATPGSEQELLSSGVAHGKKVRLSFVTTHGLRVLQLDHPTLIVPLNGVDERADCQATLFRKAGLDLVCTAQLTLNPEQPVRVEPGGYVLAVPEGKRPFHFLLVSIPGAVLPFPADLFPGYGTTNHPRLRIRNITSWCGIPSGDGLVIGIFRLRKKSSVKGCFKDVGAETVVPLSGTIRLKAESGDSVEELHDHASDDTFLNGATIQPGLAYRVRTLPDEENSVVFLGIKTIR